MAVATPFPGSPLSWLCLVNKAITLSEPSFVAYHRGGGRDAS